MGERGLTLAGLKAAARRALAREAGGVPQAVTSAQVSAALPAEAIWTGTLGTIGFWLADRMLSAATTRETPVEPLALDSPAVQGLVVEEARSVTGGAAPGTGRGAGAAAGLDRGARRGAPRVGDRRGRPAGDHAPAAREGARVVPLRARRACAGLTGRSRRGGPAARRGHAIRPGRRERRRAS